MLMVEPQVKQEGHMSDVEQMERIVIDLTMDNDEEGELESEEEDSSREDSDEDEDSDNDEDSDEDEDGNDHHCNQLMNSEQSFIFPDGKGCKNAC
jgi:hypothetical protein